MLPIFCRSTLEGELGPEEVRRFLAQAAGQLARWAESREQLHSDWLKFPLTRSERNQVRLAIQEGQKELSASRRALSGLKRGLRFPAAAEKALVMWESAERHHRNYRRARLVVDPMIENRRARLAVGKAEGGQNSPENQEG